MKIVGIPSILAVLEDMAGQKPDIEHLRASEHGMEMFSQDGHLLSLELDRNLMSCLGRCICYLLPKDVKLNRNNHVPSCLFGMFFVWLKSCCLLKGAPPESFRLPSLNAGALLQARGRDRFAKVTMAVELNSDAWNRGAATGGRLKGRGGDMTMCQSTNNKQ